MSGASSRRKGHQAKYCRCGCGRTIDKRATFARGHSHHMIPQPLRFWLKIAAPDVNGCTVWTGPVDGCGYGMFWVGDRNVRSHRYAWEMAYGFGSIPEGMQLDHLCRNRPCVNVGHLEVVSLLENIRRGECSAAVNARKTECKHGHPFDEPNTIVRPDGTRKCRACKKTAAAVYREKVRSGR